MDVKVVFLALLIARVSEAARGTSGLYIMFRNETTRLVSTRQLVVPPVTVAGKDPFAWSVDLGKCPFYVEIVAYATMDTAKHTFVGQFKSWNYFYAVDIESGAVTHIPTIGSYERYRCLSADAITGNLIAVDGVTGNLNSINFTTGELTPLMSTSSMTYILANGYGYDSNHKVLYSLVMDKNSEYSNILYVINIINKTITQRNFSATYKVCGMRYDSQTGDLYAMEYEAGWASKSRQSRDVSQPSNQTIYIGRIDQQTWKFERLVTLVVPFYSNNYLVAYSSTRGYFVLAWPEPDYDPYVNTNNGVLQIVDVRQKQTVYNDQVHGWSMRGKVGAGQNTQLLLDIAFSD